MILLFDILNQIINNEYPYSIITSIISAVGGEFDKQYNLHLYKAFIFHLW